MTVHGRVKLHDPRSKNYALAAKPVPGLSVRHNMNAPHVDQFYLGGCVGFSATNGLNTVYARKSRLQFNRKVPIGSGGYTYLGNDDGIRNYHEATLRDPFRGSYPPDDTGSSAIGLMKWWKEIGVIAGYDWTFTFDAFLAALQKQPVLLGTNWYDDMMSTDHDGMVRSSLQGTPGGHEYLANELVWDLKQIGFEQSWGQNPPGFSSTFYMSWDLVENLLIHQGGDCVAPRFL